MPRKEWNTEVTASALAVATDDAIRAVDGSRVNGLLASKYVQAVLEGSESTSDADEIRRLIVANAGALLSLTNSVDNVMAALPQAVVSLNLSSTNFAAKGQLQTLPCASSLCYVDVSNTRIRSIPLASFVRGTGLKAISVAGCTNLSRPTVAELKQASISKNDAEGAAIDWLEAVVLLDAISWLDLSTPCVTVDDIRLHAKTLIAKVRPGGLRLMPAVEAKLRASKIAQDAALVNLLAKDAASHAAVLTGLLREAEVALVLKYGLYSPQLEAARAFQAQWTDMKQRIAAKKASGSPGAGASGSPVGSQGSAGSPGSAVDPFAFTSPSQGLSQGQAQGAGVVAAGGSGKASSTGKGFASASSAGASGLGLALPGLPGPTASVPSLLDLLPPGTGAKLATPPEGGAASAPAITPATTVLPSPADMSFGDGVTPSPSGLGALGNGLGIGLGLGMGISPNIGLGLALGLQADGEGAGSAFTGLQLSPGVLALGMDTADGGASSGFASGQAGVSANLAAEAHAGPSDTMDMDTQPLAVQGLHAASPARAGSKRAASADLQDGGRPSVARKVTSSSRPQGDSNSPPSIKGQAEGGEAQPKETAVATAVGPIGPGKTPAPTAPVARALLFDGPAGRRLSTSGGAAGKVPGARLDRALQFAGAPAGEPGPRATPVLKAATRSPMLPPPIPTAPRKDGNIKKATETTARTTLPPGYIASMLERNQRDPRQARSNQLFAALVASRADRVPTAASTAVFSAVRPGATPAAQAPAVSARDAPASVRHPAVRSAIRPGVPVVGHVQPGYAESGTPEYSLLRDLKHRLEVLEQVHAAALARRAMLPHGATVIRESVEGALGLMSPVAHTKAIRLADGTVMKCGQDGKPLFMEKHRLTYLMLRQPLRDVQLSLEASEVPQDSARALHASLLALWRAAKDVLNRSTAGPAMVAPPTAARAAQAGPAPTPTAAASARLSLTFETPAMSQAQAPAGAEDQAMPALELAPPAVAVA